MTADSFDDFDDAAADRWNDGALDGIYGRKPTTNDRDYMEGWNHGRRESMVAVVITSRPEGYYHAPIGTFD